MVAPNARSIPRFEVMLPGEVELVSSNVGSQVDSEWNWGASARDQLLKQEKNPLAPVRRFKIGMGLTFKMLGPLQPVDDHARQKTHRLVCFGTSINGT